MCRADPVEGVIGSDGCAVQRVGHARLVTIVIILIAVAAAIRVLRRQQAPGAIIDVAGRPQGIGLGDEAVSAVIAILGRRPARLNDLIKRLLFASYSGGGQPNRIVMLIMLRLSS